MVNNNNFQFYQIFTMGFCGAESENGLHIEQQHRLDKIHKIKNYLQEMEINTILLGPLFSSVSHGYDTTDYTVVDRRLGTNDDLQALIRDFHGSGFKIVLDCVFNHVGRDFFAFRDLKEHRENSRYRDWFVGVNFGWNNGYNDGFAYEGWSGCENLVKLNLHHPEVVRYLLDVMGFWIDTFDIDGVRMDAANVMDRGFLANLVSYAKEKKPDFYFVGESVHGDYNDLVQNGKLDSVTNYECYKGLYSSLNDRNYFEIAYSLNRLFGEGGLYNHFYTYNFVDNHDVNRIASTLRDERLLEPLYAMLYTMPGTPAVYYGSELGLQGEKGYGTDAPLRPSYEEICFNAEHPLYKIIAKLGKVRRQLPGLRSHEYRELFVASMQMGFSRGADKEAVILFFNADENEQRVEHHCLQGDFYDVYHDERLNLSGSMAIPAFSARILVSGQSNPLTQVDQGQNWENSDNKSDDGSATGKSGKTLQDFMNIAIAEAQQALAEGEVPIGAVLVCNGEVIARNHNRKEGLQDPTAHAEMLVLREGAERLKSWRLDQCELFVTAEPCPMCMGAVIQARLKKLVYGTAEPRFGAVETTAELGKHPMLTKNMEIYSGIKEAEAQALLTDFFEKQRK